MDDRRFDGLTKSFTIGGSRRTILHGFGGSALVAGFGRLGLDGTEAKKKRKNKKRTKLQRNAFRCVNVGGKCRGNSGHCCSGICQGKKPNKGKKDTSTCVAHDVGGCQPDQDFCTAPLTSVCPDNSLGFCFRTTGTASFCGAGGGLICATCAKDADCQAQGFGEAVACVVCAACPDGTGCVQRDS